MNTTSPLNNSQSWTSAVIDFQSDAYSLIKTMSVYVLADKACVLSIAGNNGVGSFTTFAVKNIRTNIADSLTIAPKFQFNNETTRLQQNYNCIYILNKYFCFFSDIK